MPNGDARLEARFGDFDPDSPDDPYSQGGDIQNIKTYLLRGITFDTQIKIDKNLEEGSDLQEPITPEE